MSNPFKDRLRRLHDAHKRGQQTDDGPSGVYTAEGEHESGETTPDGTNPENPESTDESTGYGWERLGATKSTEWGRPIWIAHEKCTAEGHGNWSVSRFREIRHRGLAELEDEVPDETRRTDLLYMDVETTGLGDNAIVFMLGLGTWIDTETFTVEQLLLHDEEDEPGLLEAFADRLADNDVLLTYNGKKFDVPVLERRYDEHGIAPPFGEAIHVDLLPLSRRQFAGLTNYKLSTVERRVLSYQRVDDVPGRDIPRRWWKFKKNLNPDVMRGVLSHNRNDVVSMEAIVSAAISGETPKTEESTDEPRWSFSRLGFRNNATREQTPAPKTSPLPTTETGPSEKTRPRSKVAEKLERTYKLRGRFSDGGENDESGEQTDAGSSATADAPPVDTTIPPDVSAAARRRTEQLKSGARGLIDNEMWREAFPLICELVALDPHDDEGRKWLADYYRHQGDDHLARVVEARDFD